MYRILCMCLGIFIQVLYAIGVLQHASLMVGGIYFVHVHVTNYSNNY